jgi:hypothetical protein
MLLYPQEVLQQELWGTLLSNSKRTKTGAM